MPRATATWTNTDTSGWTAGSRVRQTPFKEQVLQNVEWLGQSHNHDGGTGDGGLIAVADPKALWFYGAAAGSPFA